MGTNIPANQSYVISLFWQHTALGMSFLRVTNHTSLHDQVVVSMVVSEVDVDVAIATASPSSSSSSCSSSSSAVSTETEVAAILSFGRKMCCICVIWLRHIGQVSRRSAQLEQQTRWPHGQKAVSISASIHTRHISSSWICSSRSFNSWNYTKQIL